MYSYRRSCGTAATSDMPFHLGIIPFQSLSLIYVSLSPVTPSNSWLSIVFSHSRSHVSRRKIINQESTWSIIHQKHTFIPSRKSWREWMKQEGGFSEEKLLCASSLLCLTVAYIHILWTPVFEELVLEGYICLVFWMLGYLTYICSYMHIYIWFQ